MAKKYIDAEQLKQTVETSMDMQDLYLPSHFLDVIDGIPAADVVEVVRYKECVMWDDAFVLNGKKRCLNIGVCTDGDFYCGWGSKAKMDKEENDYCSYWRRKDG